MTETRRGWCGAGWDRSVHSVLATGNSTGNMKPCPRAEFGRQTLDWKSSRITTRNTAYSNIHFWNTGIQILGLLSQITLNLARNKLVTIFLTKAKNSPFFEKMSMECNNKKYSIKEKDMTRFYTSKVDESDDQKVGNPLLLH